MNPAAQRTLFEKIWDRHVVLRREGQCLLYVDRHIIHDGSFHAFAKRDARALAVRRPRLTFGTPDHYVPTISRSPRSAQPDPPMVEPSRQCLPSWRDGFHLTDELHVRAHRRAGEEHVRACSVVRRQP